MINAKTYESMHICTYASMYICTYASMHIYTSMLVCKYASCSYMQVMQVYASMQVCKYASMKVVRQENEFKIFARCSMFAVWYFCMPFKHACTDQLQFWI